MTLRERMGNVIFETNTPASRGFDVLLLLAILVSVALVVLESVPSIRRAYEPQLRSLEWAFTFLFTLEYGLRIWSARDRAKYARSFFGIIDLLAVVPTYLSVFFLGSQYLLVIRAVRLLRVFRVLKAVRYLGEANVLVRALRASREKITVFLVTVLTLVLIIGAVMYLVEGPEHGFGSIPIAIYWAIVTLTTVGYGDIAPGTAVGKSLAAIVMILGYGIIAVPTGIVTSELTRATQPALRGTTCPSCGAGQHLADARFCRVCGSELVDA